MKNQAIYISDEFFEIDTKKIDNQKRLTLGELNKNIRSVRIYKNTNGDLLLRPVIEIPPSELWLYQNKEAMESVQQGLKDAANSNISKIDPNSL